MIIHRLLQRSNYMLSPDTIYNKPRRVKNFIYASLEMDYEESKKRRRSASSNNKAVAVKKRRR